jgi:diguanylate cyclase
VPLGAPVEEQPEAQDDAVAVADATDVRSTSGTTFVQVLKRRVTESHRFGHPLSVMHLKIDDHEILKEKYGFAIARQIADVGAPALEKALQEMDVLAKLERGEFIVMLPGKTRNEAAQVAKKMRTAAASCVLPLLERELPLKFIVNIAELKPNETALELLSRARQAAIPTATSHQAAEV